MGAIIIVIIICQKILRHQGLYYSGLPRKPEPTGCVSDIYLDFKELAGAIAGAAGKSEICRLAVTLKIPVGVDVAV